MSLRKLSIAAVLLAVICSLTAPRPAEASVSVSISVFHQHLSPYGQWVVAGPYGDCWVPAGIRSGWAPYTDGQWIWTAYGWTWVSYDPWGDYPSHYGSWAWVNPYGWVWVPGTVWAPAWVTWAYTDDYIGWAPLPPSFYLTASGYSGSAVVLASSRYCFVPTNQFVGVNVATARVPVAQAAPIFAQAAKTTNFTVSSGVVQTAGPSAQRIEQLTGRRLQQASIASARTSPTTLAAGGVSRASRWSVSAPASERARVIAATAKPNRVEAKPQPRTAEVKTKPSRPEKTANAAPRHEAPPAAKPKHESTATVVSHEKAPPAVHKPEKVAQAPNHPKTPERQAQAPAQPQAHERVAKNEHPKPLAPVKERPVASAKAPQPQHQQAAPKPQERREEVRVAHNPPPSQRAEAARPAPQAQPAPQQVAKPQPQPRPQQAQHGQEKEKKEKG